MPNRGKVLVHSRNEQTMARFLPSRYKVLWALRVSRYKVCGEQVISQGTLSFKRNKGAIAVKGFWSRFKEQDLNAKTVTNKCTLLSVLAFRYILFIITHDVFSYFFSPFIPIFLVKIFENPKVIIFCTIWIW